MRKFKKIFTYFIHSANERDLQFFERLNHIPGFYQNYTKVGPFMVAFMLLFIGLLFMPLFVLEWLSEQFGWSADVHDTLYFIYIAIIFGIIFVWLIIELVIAIKRRSIIRNYTKKRTSRHY